MAKSVEINGKYVPRIGVSGVRTTSQFYSASVSAMMAQIRAAGGEPVYIGDHKKRIKKYGSAKAAVEHDLKKLDGVVIMGSDGDIDPADYGQGDRVRSETHVDDSEEERVEYEKALASKAIEIRMPLLGVCRGMHIINVVSGGTLIQDVPSELPEIPDPSDPHKMIKDTHHNQAIAKIPPFVPVQLVKIIEGTKLAEIAGSSNKLYTPTHQKLPDGVIMENSFHHQAVKEVRNDFDICARSDDGIIEAIESKNGKVIAVQFHPEFGASDLGPKLIRHTVQMARDYAVDQHRTGPLVKDFDAHGKDMSWVAIVHDQKLKVELLKYQKHRILGRL